MAETELAEQKKTDWREEVSKNLEYYLDTEEGRGKLVNMIRAEAARLLQQMKGRQRTREIIWLSKFCLNCSNFMESYRGSMKCTKWSMKIIKPFYGKPIWSVILNLHGEKLKITDFDWRYKSLNVSDILVEEAIKRINKGYPYPCFEYGG